MPIEAKVPTTAILPPGEICSIGGDSRFIQPRLTPFFEFDSSLPTFPQNLDLIDRAELLLSELVDLSNQNTCPEGKKWNKNKQKCVANSQATISTPSPDYYQIPDEYQLRAIEPSMLIAAFCSNRETCNNKQLILENPERAPTPKEVRKSLQEFMYNIFLRINSEGKIEFPITDSSGKVIASYPIDKNDIVNFLEFVTRDPKEQLIQETANRQISTTDRYKNGFAAIVVFLTITVPGLLFFRRQQRERNKLEEYFRSKTAAGTLKEREELMRDDLRKRQEKLQNSSPSELLSNLNWLSRQIEFDYEHHHKQTSDMNVNGIKEILDILNNRGVLNDPNYRDRVDATLRFPRSQGLI